MPTPLSSAGLAHLHASFLAIVLPRVLSHGHICFRDIKCSNRREECIQDMIGLAMESAPGQERQGCPRLSHSLRCLWHMLKVICLTEHGTDGSGPSGTA